MPLWARRVLTRLLAIVPVIICVIIYGGSETAVEDLLLYTQVFLSIALPVSIIPLTMYTSDKINGPICESSVGEIFSLDYCNCLDVIEFILIYGTLTGLTINKTKADWKSWPLFFIEFARKKW